MPTMQQEQAQQQAHMHQLHTLQVTKASAGEEESQRKVANKSAKQSHENSQWRCQGAKKDQRFVVRILSYYPCRQALAKF